MNEKKKRGRNPDAIKKENLKKLDAYIKFSEIKKDIKDANK